VPELRKDPVTEGWVIIATERSKRPSDFKTKPEDIKGSFCPFCNGNEEKTPPEIVAFREPGSKQDQPGWWVRVVPNKFPALRPEALKNMHRNGIYESMDGSGVHEVIIENPTHEASIEELSERQISEIIWAWLNRYQDLKNDKSLRYIQIFKNFGSIAGASLEHVHSQLIGTPMIPTVVRDEIEGAKRYHARTGHCVFCDMIRQETENRERVTSETEMFIAVEPYASRFPFETWILPKQHEPDFGNITEAGVRDLARSLRNALGQLGKALEKPPYNMVLHTSPINDGAAEDYHWHVEILPRLTVVAGFEWGTGFYINPTKPEDAAHYLREAMPPYHIH